MPEQTRKIEQVLAPQILEDLKEIADIRRARLLTILDFAPNIELLKEVEGDIGAELESVYNKWDVMDLQNTKPLWITHDGKIHHNTDIHLSGEFVNKPLISMATKRIKECEETFKEAQGAPTITDKLAELLTILLPPENVDLYQFDEDDLIKLDTSHDRVCMESRLFPLEGGKYKTVYIDISPDGSIEHLMTCRSQPIKLTNKNLRSIEKAINQAAINRIANMHYQLERGTLSGNTNQNH